MKSTWSISFILAFLWAGGAQALEVLACEPEWAALTRELAGNRAEVSAATTARQDPHHIEARPALIAKARRADLLVCTGAELEIGWLPLLQRESGNAAIQNGRRGYFEAASAVSLIERPQRVDRAMGDVHASGNPHFHLEPRRLLQVARALRSRLAEIDPAGAAEYQRREADFVERFGAAITRWEREAQSLRGMKVLTHHRNFSYLAAWLGLDVVAELEPKPGIEPSAAHLAELLASARAQSPRAVLRAAYESPRASEWIAQRAQLKAIELPYTVGGSPRAQDLFGLFEETLARLKEAAG